MAAMALAIVLIGCGGIIPAPSGSAIPSLRATSTPAETALSPAKPLDAEAIASAIDEAGLRARLDALAAVSTASARYRAVGTAGYQAATELVVSALRDAGWTADSDAFSMPGFTDPGHATLTVGDATFTPRDILPLIYAPPGDVSGPVVAIDWADGAIERTGKGCDAADYAGLPPGAIVVVRPGPCFRRDQVMAAQSAGAAGFVAAYPEAGAGAALRATLIDPAGLDIPAVGVSRPVAEAMVRAAEAGEPAHLVTDATTADVATRSIIAQLPGTDPNRVVMLGAHLDSVVDGPGINDDGSGVAALLEIAAALRGSVPEATIRLAFWGGEELGLAGSSSYIRNLPEAERGRIVAYLNADMLASPNGIAGVYDVSGSPSGSDAVRDALMAAVTRHGGVPEPIDPGGSDHQPFAQAGIPVGGVFSGANEIITASQATSSGATEGRAADPCYHQPCDDGSALDLGLARRLTSALAEVAVSLASCDADGAGSD